MPQSERRTRGDDTGGDDTMATPAFAARSVAVAVLLASLPGDGFAQTPVPPPPNGADYWTELGFKTHTLKGPETAKGIVFWSHGLDGRRAQYQYPPPPVIELFAKEGWDVLKIGRNPVNETTWLNSGLKHVRDLSERVDKAKADGYRNVLVAGQSYGGAISIEAAARNGKIDGVLALSPGQGSDAGNIGNTRNFDSLTVDLIASLDGVRTGKIVVLVAENDVLHPLEVRGPKLRAALQKKPAFVLFDETMPIKGHGAGGTLQFSAWYGPCLLRFMGEAAPGGETVCPPPPGIPIFLTVPNQKIEPPPPDIPPALAGLSGAWHGKLPEEGVASARLRDVGIVVETVSAAKASIVYQLGAGPDRNLNMDADRLAVNWEGDRFIYRSGSNKFSLSVLPPKDGTMRLIVTGSSTGKVFDMEMRREGAP